VTRQNLNVIETDVLIIGAGAAGLMCAMEAGKRKRRVMVIDHARRPAEKVRISGGGRCNFTNLHTSPANFLSQNPRYAISALARYTPEHFIALVEKHGIRYHEKTLEQLFCDRSSQDIINMLLAECEASKVQIRLQTTGDNIQHDGSRFRVDIAGDSVSAESLVVASGGLSIPKMGATGIGYNIARAFGLRIVSTKPALVPFVLSETDLKKWHTLAGVAVPAEAHCGKATFREGILFTHRGLSGPAALQVSSYWDPPNGLRVNLAPGEDIGSTLRDAKRLNPKSDASAVLSQCLPKRLANRILEQELSGRDSSRLADIPDKVLDSLGAAVNNWHLKPAGTEGYRTAEVTLGGVDTRDLSSQTMAARALESLFFIGEVVDITGHLGGFNFQWAWASGFVAGQYA
jgi:predicted Rossmann fold flavoprotein